jgi:hypothetical protein
MKKNMNQSFCILEKKKLNHSRSKSRKRTDFQTIDESPYQSGKNNFTNERREAKTT